MRAVIATLILSVVCSLGTLAQMGQVKSCSQNKGKVTVNSANGKTIIEFYSDDMVKITPIYKGCRLLPKASASVQLTPLKTKAVVKKDADRITVAHGNITVDINRETSQVSPRNQSLIRPTAPNTALSTISARLSTEPANAAWEWTSKATLS